MSQADLFDKESTVSQSASHIVRLMILQQLDSVLLSWRMFLVSSSSNSSARLTDERVLFAHISCLLGLCRSAWKRHDKEAFGLVEKLVEKQDSSVINYFLEFLDAIELTRFDTKEKYDRQDIVKSNKHHGYT